MKIDRVEIKNFKSLKDINIELNNLTLLTGINSTGKSSFIQALLLMKQNEKYFNIVSSRIALKKLSDLSKKNGFSFSDDSYLEIKSLELNREYIKLGDIKTILYQDSFKEDILLRLYYHKKNISISFSEINIRYDIDIITNDEKIVIEELIKNDVNIFNNFQYIMTDRVAPQISYGLSEKDIKKNLIGHSGEYTAHYLAVNKNKILEIEKLRHKESKTNQFLENVSLWLGEISNGIDISSEVYQDMQLAKLTYQYTYGKRKSNNYSPLNVGFGVTYVLPIIVSILKAKLGDLLIIENPESHLHPAGQSKIAELCSIAAANGVQIIVETHSDHFLNGLRVATKKGIIKPKESNIYYFRKEINSLETKIDKLNVDKYGNINDWPDGFFDEWDKKLDDLLGI